MNIGTTNNIHVAFSSLMMDLDVFMATMLHELAHSDECGIQENRKEHYCCDTISVQCGFPILANAGEKYVNSSIKTIMSYINNSNPLNSVVRETSKIWNQYLATSGLTKDNPYTGWEKVKKLPSRISYEQYFPMVWGVNYSTASKHCKNS